MPQSTSGYRPQQITTLNAKSNTLLEKYCAMAMSPYLPKRSGYQMQTDQDEVDQFDTNKRDDHPAEPPDQQIPPEEGVRTERLVGHPFERDGDEQRDDEGIEDHGRENGG